MIPKAGAGKGWLKFVMDLGALDAERVEAVFSRHGAHSITLTDAADDPVLEPAPGETPLWSDTRISGLFSRGADLHSLQRDLLQSFDLAEPPRFTVEEIEDRDWEREYLQHARPISIGGRLWICPAGTAVVEPDAVIVALDPGLAFGSGSHPTTAMCLAWLSHQDLEGKNILDFGCGSGILAIAALKLGATSCTVTDIDEQAITASLQNAERNDVGERLHVLDDLEAACSQFDVVLANILAGPLIANAEQLCRVLRPSGDVVLSGILREQADEVTGTYRSWIDFEPPARAEEWICLCGKKR